MCFLFFITHLVLAKFIVFDWLFYCFHENIDCLKKCIMPISNPFPFFYTGVIFISIRLKEGCLKTVWKCSEGSENTVSRHLKLKMNYHIVECLCVVGLQEHSSMDLSSTFANSTTKLATHQTSFVSNPSFLVLAKCFYHLIISQNHTNIREGKFNWIF